MNDVISIVDPGYNHWVWIVPGLVFVSLLLGTILVAAYGKSEDTAGGLGASAFIALLVMIAGVAAVGPAWYSQSVQDAKSKAIEGLGYSHVEISGDKFTAKAEDGSYFEGYLMPTEDLTWRIIDLGSEEK